MTAPVLRSLLTGLIDYAGLFPPAGLGMDAAVRNYDSYVQGEHAWMLGKFILPAARLEEYAEAVRNAGIDASAWSLSVLATASDADVITRFNTGGDESGAGGSGSIDVLEIKAANTREIQDAAQAFGGGLPDLLRDAAGQVAFPAAGDRGGPCASEDPDRRRGGCGDS